jgi:sugar lactone lactonase YvrE
MRLLFALTTLALCAVTSAADEDELFVAKPMTEKNSFTAGIEGPACDHKGNLYLVAMKKASDIAIVTPDGKAEVWVELPGKSFGNGTFFTGTPMANTVRPSLPRCPVTRPKKGSQ